MIGSQEARLHCQDSDLLLAEFDSDQLLRRSYQDVMNRVCLSQGGILSRLLQSGPGPHWELIIDKVGSYVTYMSRKA